ncbi:tryptophan decarboxylase 2-like [Cryptomeria japonica]|uniref:tryptophan decarboxylase 2-like n=1 Tax=Cryptomeria japonica TaxID=3369 RepID=UPI0027DA415D|nr:tryptophan decarboxylase 2-like [Cryptomeria japonica]
METTVLLGAEQRNGNDISRFGHMNGNGSSMSVGNVNDNDLSRVGHVNGKSGPYDLLHNAYMNGKGPINKNMAKKDECSDHINHKDFPSNGHTNGNGNMNGENDCNGSGSHSYLSKPLDIEEFRKHAHTMVDFIADYYNKVESFPVLSQVNPGYLSSWIPESAPQNPDSVESLLTDVKEKMIPALTHWQSPNFYAYFPAGLSTASFLGEMLSSGFAIVNLHWMTSPAATELETIVCDWLGKIVNLTDSFLSSSGKGGGGVIQGSASEAVLVSLLAARNKALKKFRVDSVDKLVVYVSDQTHCSIEKACKIAGICEHNVRVIATSCSTNYGLSTKNVRDCILKDISVGLHPTFLCATIGTTSSTSVDPVQGLSKLACEHDIWFHVDGAYGGAACICPEYQHYLEGIDNADSFVMNPHKWLFTNFDCCLLWVKDSKALVEALSMNPEYLKNKVSQSKQVIDYKDWQIPLGSRFRSLKLWMVLRLYGISELQTYIRYQISLAQHFENLVIKDKRFEVMAPRTFALVCFRILPTGDDCDNGHSLNSQLLDVVNESGHMYLSHTVLSGKYTLRFCVNSVLTKVHHVDAAWKLLQSKASILLK